MTFATTSNYNTIDNFELILTVHRRYYVEIKCQLDAKDDICVIYKVQPDATVFSLLLCNTLHVSGFAHLQEYMKLFMQPYVTVMLPLCCDVFTCGISCIQGFQLRSCICGEVCQRVRYMACLSFCPTTRT